MFVAMFWSQMLTVILLTGLMPRLSGADRVVAWQVQSYYDRENKVINYAVGDQSNEGGVWKTIGLWYCWLPQVGKKGGVGVCVLKFKVSNENGQNHFQIRGSSYTSYDIHSSVLCSTTSQGYLGDGKLAMADGHAWNECKSKLGYRYLYVYGKWTTERPLIGAFTYQHVKKKDPSVKLDEVTTTGYKGAYDTKHELVQFQGSSQKWGDSTIIILRYYEPPTTLVGFDPHYSETYYEDVDSVVAKYRVIKNEGCGDVGTWESGMTGTQTDTTEITLTTTIGWSVTYSYSFDVTASVSSDIGIVATELSSTSGFNYETSADFEQTQTVTETTSYVWPTYCPTGYRCKTELIRITTRGLLPATLTFKRGNETYTEENSMITYMQATQENDSQELIEGFVNPCT